ncbi:glutathione S-transferase family protein [Jannaschia sp. S6380]|uniref:glutathione S-transferase family protein n=1 Tax=Jannaschia sp. S6380 TaxID=2926408 RepID=UPI001FF2C445|nr:glutathione S-transferase family protein [Jannaschia sp. S6380]MCK0167095.1 glutathione S-transferase family protein [Jannaschia sp. S6380]
MTPVLHLAPGTISLCVHAALAEANLPHELRWLDFKAGAQHGADHLALNPKGRVPVLVTDDGPLTEAAAILEWIAETAYPDLMPADRWQAAKAREMMLYLASTVHVNHAHKLRGSRWADDTEAHAAMRAKVAENMAENAAYLEDRLTDDWVVADFSAADLYLWNVTRWLPGDGVPLEGYPRLAAHHDRVAARPAVAGVIALHGG